MKETDIEKFEKMQTQLHGLYEEISALSKKAPNDAVNKFKLKFINEVLSQSDGILTSQHKPFDEFKRFDEDDLPTNSDVALILSQYLNCMEELRVDNIEQPGGGGWYWLVNGEISTMRTSAPKKLKGER